MPAANRQDELQPGFVREFRGFKVMIPTRIPAFQHFGHAQPAGTILPKQTQLEFIGAVHPRIFAAHLKALRS